MTSPSQMIYCFDTSAINQLCDDADRDAIVAGLLAAHNIRITAVNCLEVLGTKDENRRQVLQSFLRKLAAGNAPLVLPIDLLKLLTLEYGAGGARPDSENLNYRMSVDEYFNLEMETEQNIQQLRQRWEASFEAFANVRPTFEQMFKEGKARRPSSFSDLIREHYQEEAFLFSMMRDLYAITGEELEVNGLTAFFTNVPEWPVVLLGLAYASYSRSMKEEGYGRKGKAGAIDLWSSTYLLHADVFVTHDKDQFRGLRFANKANPRPTSTLRYTEFRQGLLIG